MIILTRVLSVSVVSRTRTALDIILYTDFSGAPDS